MSVVTAALKPLIRKGDHLLVGCSGGVDSMTLLHALLQINAQPEVLHVNYGLRGTESDADEQLVRTFCEKAGLKLRVIHCKEEQFRATGVNLQAAAREVRREAFGEWISRSPNHKVVLAHHADDQIETFFLQLFRGSGTFGLGGMHEEREGIIRPFLWISKSELINYAVEKNVSWREDRSNASSWYLRNLFRNELLPVLRGSNSDLEEQVLFMMAKFRERQSELFAQVKQAVLQFESDGTIPCAVWLQWEEDTRLAFLKSIHWPVWASARLTELANGRVNASLIVGRNRIRKVTYATLQLENEAQKTNWDFKIETIEILPSVFDKQTIYLDADKLEGPLFFRTKCTGDRIRSLGMKGSQLVSDVMKDAGLPLSERENHPLLSDGKRILWIPGIKISRDALAQKETPEIIAVSIV